MTTFALAWLIAAAPADPLVFEMGDRVVLLGGTLIEREQKYGFWELALTLKNAGKHVSFRNLGWSGDTVWCESRGSFDPASKGFERTVQLVKELKPTVIVICYGQVESFDGADAVKKFAEGLGKLVDALTATKARIVLMTPTPFEDVHPQKNAAARNQALQLYNQAAEQLATNKSLGFVDLYARTQAAKQAKILDLPLTENGIHLGSEGYRASSQMLLGTKLPTESTLDTLRQKIIEKNELFFHRWRPQNQTYLFGFRKHEQGRNAKEIAEFDPLVQALEKEIIKLTPASPPCVPR